MVVELDSFLSYKSVLALLCGMVFGYIIYLLFKRDGSRSISAEVGMVESSEDGVDVYSEKGSIEEYSSYEEYDGVIGGAELIPIVAVKGEIETSMLLSILEGEGIESHLYPPHWVSPDMYVTGEDLYGIKGWIVVRRDDVRKASKIVEVFSLGYGIDVIFNEKVIGYEDRSDRGR